MSELMILRVAGLGLAPASVAESMNSRAQDALLRDRFAREDAAEREIRRQPDRLALRAPAPICAGAAQPVARA